MKRKIVSHKIIFELECGHFAVRQDSFEPTQKTLQCKECELSGMKYDPLAVDIEFYPETPEAAARAAEWLKEMKDGERAMTRTPNFEDYYPGMTKEEAEAAGPKSINSLCEVCDKPQFMTAGGASCPDGHGGAAGYVLL